MSSEAAVHYTLTTHLQTEIDKLNQKIAKRSAKLEAARAESKALTEKYEQKIQNHLDDIKKHQAEISELRVKLAKTESREEVLELTREKLQNAESLVKKTIEEKDQAAKDAREKLIRMVPHLVDREGMIICKPIIVEALGEVVDVQGKRHSGDLLRIHNDFIGMIEVKNGGTPITGKTVTILEANVPCLEKRCCRPVLYEILLARQTKVQKFSAKPYCVRKVGHRMIITLNDMKNWILKDGQSQSDKMRDIVVPLIDKHYGKALRQVFLTAIDIAATNSETSLSGLRESLKKDLQESIVKSFGQIALSSIADRLVASSLLLVEKYRLAEKDEEDDDEIVRSELVEDYIRMYIASQPQHIDLSPFEDMDRDCPCGETRDVKRDAQAVAAYHTDQRKLLEARVATEAAAASAAVDPDSGVAAAQAIDQNHGSAARAAVIPQTGAAVAEVEDASRGVAGRAEVIGDTGDIVASVQNVQRGTAASVAISGETGNTALMTQSSAGIRFIVGQDAGTSVITGRVLRPDGRVVETIMNANGNLVPCERGIEINDIPLSHQAIFIDSRYMGPVVHDIALRIIAVTDAVAGHHLPQKELLIALRQKGFVENTIFAQHLTAIFRSDVYVKGVKGSRNNYIVGLKIRSSEIE